MPYLPISPDDIDWAHYLRDDASALSRDNIWLKVLADEQEAERNAWEAWKAWGRAIGRTYAMQVIREFGPLPKGRVKR